MRRHATVARGVLVLCGLVAASCARVGDRAGETALAGAASVTALESAAPPTATAELATPPAPEPTSVAHAAPAGEAAAPAEMQEPVVAEQAATSVGTAAERTDDSGMAVAEAPLPVSAPTAALEPPASVSRPSAETLDFKALVIRLRKTKAINLSTKLSVKNLSDDLLEDFRAYHSQRGTVSLVELRRSYDSLFQRLHSLLHDADPPLDRDIDRSRAALWEILADPRKFSAAKLMAGA